MSAINSAGFIDLLKSSGASFDAAFEAAMPMQEALFDELGLLMLAASFIGSILTVLAMPTGMTDGETLKKQAGILIVSWLLVYPLDEVDAKDINPLTRDDASYDIGYGVYASMKVFSYVLNTTGQIAASLSGAGRDRALGATTLALTSLTDASAKAYVGESYTDDIVRVASEYTKLCNSELMKQKKLGANSEINLDVLNNDAGWQSVGLLGGNTLGLVDSPNEYVSLPSSVVGSVFSVMGVKVEPRVIQSEHESLIALKKLGPASGFMLGEDGTYIELGAGNDQGVEYLKRSQVPGLEQSYNSTFDQNNPLLGKSYFDNYSSDDARFNAVNCYQLYLIANKAMNVAHSQASDKVQSSNYISSQQSIEGGTSSLEDIEETIKDSKEINYFIASSMANEALQSNYRFSERNHQEQDILQDGVDTIQNLGNAAAISFFESRDQLVPQSFATDVNVPVAFGSAILVITFVLSFLPIFVTVSIIMPGRVDSNMAWLQIILFAVVFLMLMTLMYTFYDVWLTSTTEAMIQDIVFNNSKPSGELASLVKSLTYAGFAIISIALMLAYVIVFDKAPIISKPSFNTRINLPKFGPGNSPSPAPDNSNIRTDFDLGGDPNLRLGGPGAGPGPDGDPALAYSNPPKINPPMSGGERLALTHQPAQIVNFTAERLSTDTWGSDNQEPASVGAVDRPSTSANTHEKTHSSLERIEMASSSSFIENETVSQSEYTTELPTSFDMPGSAVDRGGNTSIPRDFDVPVAHQGLSGSENRMAPVSVLSQNHSNNGDDVYSHDSLPQSFDVPGNQDTGLSNAELPRDFANPTDTLQPNNDKWDDYS